MNKRRVTAAVVNVLFASSASMLISAISTADTSSLSNRSASFSQVDDTISSLEARFGLALVLVGRVDALGTGDDIFVMGQRVIGAPTPGLTVGDYVAVLGQPAKQGLVSADLVYSLTEQYVPGASSILIRAVPSSVLSERGQITIGAQYVDLTPTLGYWNPAELSSDSSLLRIVGTQPVAGGVILAGAAKIDGSLGTGKGNGSLGTGRGNGSLGTGKVDGSLGTGKADGSLGTGKADGSLGTGKGNGSLGTGRGNGSLGTG